MIIGLVLFLTLGYVFTEIYVYFTIAVVLAAILKPLVRFITKLQVYGSKFPRFLAVLLSFLSLAMVIFIFSLLFLPLISEQLGVISGLDYNTVTQRIGVPLQSLEEFLISYGLTNSEPGFIAAEINLQFQSLISQIDVASIVNGLLSITGTVFIAVLAVTFITFFLLYEMGPIRRWLISLISNKYFEVTIAALNKVERLLTNYLFGLLLQMIAIFTLASIGLSLIGIKYALTIAMFAAIANIIPYLGPLLGAAFGILVGVTISPELVTGQDYLFLFVKIASVFAVVQISDNVVWQPLIFSKSVKAHPLEIFIVIFAGATLAGIVGMILAIPAYTVLRVTFIEFLSGYKRYKIFKIQTLKFR